MGSRAKVLAGNRPPCLIDNPVNPRPKFKIRVSKIFLGRQASQRCRAPSCLLHDVGRGSETDAVAAMPMEARWVQGIVTRDLLRWLACGQAAVDLYAFEVLAGGVWSGHAANNRRESFLVVSAPEKFRYFRNSGPLVMESLPPHPLQPAKPVLRSPNNPRAACPRSPKVAEEVRLASSPPK